MVFDYFEVFLMSSKPNDHRLIQFSDYLLNNYKSNDAVFPPNIWAAATADLNRTLMLVNRFIPILIKVLILIILIFLYF